MPRGQKSDATHRTKPQNYPAISRSGIDSDHTVPCQDWLFAPTAVLLAIFSADSHIFEIRKNQPK